MASEPKTTGLTYEDLLSMFPEVDNVRRELIGGELIVTPAPSTRHQRVVLLLGARLLAHTERYGGEVYVAPTDVYFSRQDVVEPDVVFVRSEHLARVEEKLIRSAPDVVVEVSSPSTRKLELGRKRDLYANFGVPEYWFVDLRADRVDAYRLEGAAYAAPRTFRRGDVLESPEIPGFSLSVDELLGRS